MELDFEHFTLPFCEDELITYKDSKWVVQWLNTFDCWCNQIIMLIDCKKHAEEYMLKNMLKNPEHKWRLIQVDYMLSSTMKVIVEN